MIKRRYGEEFHTKISENLEIKAIELKQRNARDGKRRPRDGK
jgi:hypothetical protein